MIWFADPHDADADGLVARHTAIYVRGMKRWIPFVKTRPLVSVVRLSGVIAASGRSAGLSDQTLAPILERAFRRGKPDAVALLINSPGGSPVQSSLIGARIRRLSVKKSIPVHAFVEDVAASGGYWLASAADKIWVDASSVVGSIGVVSSSFGAHDFIARHGIERRVHTAGKSKSMLDPFRPEDPADIARLNGILAQIHTTFIEHVKSRRGDRLKLDGDLFTGEIWVGAQSVERGLADGIDHLEAKMSEIFGEDVTFRAYGPKRKWFSRLGVSMLDQTLATLEDRVEYARYGI